MPEGPSGKKIYGLIGDPVRHSLSPAMHNAAFKALGMDAEYKLFPLQEEELENFLKNAGKENIHGLNVTVPYKEKVIRFLNTLSEDARSIGAVNTVKVSDDKLEGFNTDGRGFLTHLKEEGFNPQNKRIAILGAGGACRAVAYVLAGSGAGEIALLDIDKTKSENIVRMINKSFPGCKIYAVEKNEQLDLRNKDLLINATPAGLKESDPVLMDEEMMHKDLFVYDLIYNPPETKLLALAKKAGAAASNSLGMLLYQGALAFEIWTARPAPVEVMRKALLEGINK